MSWRALGGRTAGVRALAILPSQILLPCRFCALRVGERARQDSSGCASKSAGTRKSPSYLARRLATARLQLAVAMMMCIRITQRFTRGRFVPILALWRASCSYRPATASRASVRNAASFFVHFVGVRFCGGWCSHIFQWAHWATRRGLKEGFLAQWAGSFGISWCILSLAKKTLHCRRAGFEPQHTSPYMKRVNAHQVIGEAVRARTTIPHFVLLFTLFVVLASSIVGDRLF